MDILSTGKRLINEGVTAASEALSALVLSNSDVGLLDFGRVIVQRDYATIEGVKIISGGESGHEPSYAGFVGKGMLTAAVQGDIFKAPSAKDVLRTIKELAHGSDDGILLIVQNNSGDRLNFGLALERAHNDDIRIKMLVVADDCNLNGLHKERRGLSAIILMHKISGAMVDDKKNLDEIFDYCNKALKGTSSILMCLKPCTSLTLDTCICTRYNTEDTYETGTGLHGEPGLKIEPLINVKEVCKSLIEELTNKNLSHALELNSTTPIVLLINNLGSTTKIEELIFVREFVHQLHELEVPVARIYYGSYFTSLDTIGFTVTIMKIFDEKLTYYLDKPCSVPAWIHKNSINLGPELEQQIVCKTRRHYRKTASVRGPKFDERQSNILQLIVQFACDALISCERQLNQIDSETGDGDTGSCLRRGAEAILTEIINKKLNTYYPFTFLESLSKLLEIVMGGVLGCIYSIFFESGAKAFSNLNEDHVITANDWLKALKKANKALKRYTNVEVGDCTMYDSLHACATFFEESLKSNNKQIESFGHGVSAAEGAAQRTKKHNRKYPDPGAHAVGIWMRAVFEGVKLRCSDD